ncbi:hypothetical protein EON83_20085 [bacterium]|nr:MAG: hypothetical protein EON83_20085 [bacterium]
MSSPFSSFERPADSFLPQPDRHLLHLEQYMARRINEERAAYRLSQLTSHALLAAVARAHSAEMRDLNYFAHESPTRHLHTPANRYVYAYGHEPGFLSENVAWRRVETWTEMHGIRIGSNNAAGTITQEDVEVSHQGLMDSPGHRANILEPSIELQGVGIVARGRELWVTQLFSRR